MRFLHRLKTLFQRRVSTTPPPAVVKAEGFLFFELHPHRGLFEVESVRMDTHQRPIYTVCHVVTRHHFDVPAALFVFLFQEHLLQSEEDCRRRLEKF